MELIKIGDTAVSEQKVVETTPINSPEEEKKAEKEKKEEPQPHPLLLYAHKERICQSPFRGRRKESSLRKLLQPHTPYRVTEVSQQVL